MTQVPDAPYIREAETKGYWPLWQNSGGESEADGEDDCI